MHVHMCVCMCVICVLLCACIGVNTCVCAAVYMHMCTYMYVRVCESVCVGSHADACMLMWSYCSSGAVQLGWYFVSFETGSHIDLGLTDLAQLGL